VYIHRSYRKIKTGVPLFLEHPVLRFEVVTFGQLFVDGKNAQCGYFVNKILYLGTMAISQTEKNKLTTQNGEILNTH